MKIVDDGLAAVVTCQGSYERPEATTLLRFMHVWVKKPNGWKIAADSASK